MTFREEIDTFGKGIIMRKAEAAASAALGEIIENDLIKKAE